MQYVTLLASVVIQVAHMICVKARNFHSVLILAAPGVIKMLIWPVCAFVLEASERTKRLFLILFFFFKQLFAYNEVMYLFLAMEDVYL